MSLTTKRNLSFMTAVIGMLACVVVASRSEAGPLCPYEADENTLHLYHFDETGVPIADQGMGTQLHLDTALGTFGVPAFPGFGSAFDVAAGDAEILEAFNDIPTPGSPNYPRDGDGKTWNNGHAAHSFNHAQSEHQGTDGAFTYEALINISTITNEIESSYAIISRDGLDSGPVLRGVDFRIVPLASQSVLQFYDASPRPERLYRAPIPTFSPNEWYHVAVTYNGQEGTEGNLKIYWTELLANTGAANEIGSFTMPADAPADRIQTFFVGNSSRGPYRLRLPGVIDEVRISNIARGPDEFCLAPTYACVGFEPPMDRPPVKVKKNRALPLKAQLFDSRGNPVTDANIPAPPVVQVIFQPGTPEAEDVSDEAVPVGLGTEGNQFVFTEDQKWQYNLKTKDFTAPGTYQITMVPGNTYEFALACETFFVIE